ncbi:ankyrin [Gonapodya prolifera JEL478]|uniref:Ankyrin n=1 Tax=Gonapodya prolifera (strain JEL478) TaxID=1344416 RepID=A0A139AG32_GONPJ|nr:ankyrin [Gonapodya prolifera JEL478]|eukprot:KXS15373.1 ankyrin [Gonapodya prolifera JEL478]
MVDLLVQYGVELPVGRRDIEPLTHAASLGHGDIADILLKAGADPNTNNGLPLLEAANAGHADIVETLLNHSADVHVQGDRALLDAAETGWLDVVTLLLNRGADVHAQGDRVLLCVVEMGAREHRHNVGTWFDPLKHRRDHFKVAELLLRRGANTTVTDTLGRTPLDIAAEYNHSTLINLLCAIQSRSEEFLAL